MNYMGVDIGTGSCKAVVFDENGRQLAIANHEYNVIFCENGGAELDSDEVIKKCFEVIKDCTSQVAAGSVRGLGISSQGEAFTAIGAENQTLCNAMISSDMRSQSYSQTWAKKFGEEKLYQVTGHTAHPMFTVFKLLWLKEHKPEIWNKIQKILCFEDLLQFRLGLEPAISWSLAGRTMMFDVRKKEWNQDILREVGVSPDQLAKSLPAGTIVGTIDDKIAQNLGLSNDTFVVTGGHDQSCGALGAGVIQTGIAMYATGTVECVTLVTDKPIFNEKLQRSNLCTYNYTLNEMYATIAYSLTGGNILRWFRDEFGTKEKMEAEQKGVDPYNILLKTAGEKPSSLIVLPYFTPSGTPYFDTKTKGAILGLRLSTSRGEFIRALLEGVAFEMRLNFEILEKSGYGINELYAIGGGAKSASWMQLKADVTGKKITTLDSKEAGCLGVAMLACAADTGKRIRDLVENWIKPVSTVYPQSQNKKWYNERFKLYCQLYSSIKEIPL